MARYLDDGEVQIDNSTQVHFRNAFQQLIMIAALNVGTLLRANSYSIISFQIGLLLGLASRLIGVRTWQGKAPRLSGGAFAKGFRGTKAMRIVSASRSGSLSVLVDLALRQLREGLVSLLFLGERRF